MRKHFSNNIVGYIAIFLVVTTGTANALGGHNTVFSDDIVNGQVKTKDLKGSAVNGAKVADGSLTGADIDDGSLAPLWSQLVDVPDGFADGIDDVGGGGGTATGLACVSCVDGGEVVNDSVTGVDILESSLGLVPAATLGGFGRWTNPGVCNPGSTTFIDCGYVSLTLPATSRVLVQAAVRGFSPGGSGFGFCRLATSSGVIAGSDMGVWVNTSAPLLGMVVLGAGGYDIGIECNQVSGDAQFEDISVAATALTTQ